MGMSPSTMRACTGAVGQQSPFLEGVVRDRGSEIPETQQRADVALTDWKPGMNLKLCSDVPPL